MWPLWRCYWWNSIVIPTYLKTFEGSGVCGIWYINSCPHFVPGQQTVPKLPDKYDDVTNKTFLLPQHTKFEGKGACKAGDAKSSPHSVFGM